MTSLIKNNYYWTLENGGLIFNSNSQIKNKDAGINNKDAGHM